MSSKPLENGSLGSEDFAGAVRNASSSLSCALFESISFESSADLLDSGSVANF